jgi:hypothetical protein
VCLNMENSFEYFASAHRPDCDVFAYVQFYFYL